MHVRIYAYVHVHYHVRQILSYRMTQTRSFQLYSLVSYGYFTYQLILQKKWENAISGRTKLKTLTFSLTYDQIFIAYDTVHH